MKRASVRLCIAAALAAMLFGQVEDETGIVAVRPDFLSVADDLRVVHQSVQVFIVERNDAARLEPEECLFEAVPLLLDDLPRKAGVENTLGHAGEVSMIGHRRDLGFGFRDR